MKPLICPQCGGKITQYSLWESFAICGYCGTRFLIEREKTQSKAPSPVVDSPAPSNVNPQIIFGVVAVALIFIGGVTFFTVISKIKKEPNTVYPISSTPYRTPTPRISPTPTPKLNLVEFGGKGTGNGLFQDADSIAVDTKGRIYVADRTLRVQQFDEQGKFLKLWQIPSATQFYDRARNIQKIAVNDQNQLHVLVGGVIFVYEEASSEPKKAIYFSPDAILDFALRSDGSKLFVVTDDRIDTLYHVSDKGKTLNKIVGFHTKTADAALDPPTTALAAIRLAVDGAGNIFSIYAFGDLGSYQLSYNSDELLIFRFTPEGKYVNKFVETMNSCGIEIDNQSRIHISDGKFVTAYSNTGHLIGSVADLTGIDAFALDKQNNVYVLHNDVVIKRPPIQ